MKARALAGGIVVLMVLTGCAAGRVPAQPRAGSVVGRDAADPPAPEKFSVAKEVGQQGGDVTGERAAVTVPPGAWAEGETGTVSIGDPLSSPDAVAASPLRWGAPVQVEHESALRRALRVTWDVSGLNQEQERSLVLTRWDARHRAWEAQGTDFTMADGVLTAAIDNFSVWTWFTSGDATQLVGELTGKRAEAPRCGPTPLPSWVTSVVHPDQDVAAAAMRACAEGTRDPDRILAKVVNNRSFTQHLTLVPDGARWVSARQEEVEVSATGALWAIAHRVLDDGSAFLVPPTSEVQIVLERPPSPESVHLEISARADRTAIFADLLEGAVDYVGVPDLESPVAQAFLTTYLECGGSKLSQSAPTSAKDAVSTTLGTVHDCAAAVSEDPDGLVAQSLRKEKAKGGGAATRGIQADRATARLGHLLWYINYAEALEYLGSQIADAAVGPTTFGIDVDGRPPALGRWLAACSDADVDSDRLYRNLGRQDAFIHAATELWRLPAWKASGQRAIAPLGACSSEHRRAVAGNIIATWGVDARSARVIAGLVSSAMTVRLLQVDDILSAPVPASCQHEAGTLVDGDLPLPVDPDLGYSLSGDASVNDGLPPVLVDLDGDGVDELVGILHCTAGGVGWPELVLVYSPGPELVGYVDLGSKYEFEHAYVDSLTPTADGLKVVWNGYDGCCGDQSWYTGYLRPVDYQTDGQYDIVDVQEGKDG